MRNRLGVLWKGSNSLLVHFDHFGRLDRSHCTRCICSRIGRTKFKENSELKWAAESGSPSSAQSILSIIDILSNLSGVASCQVKFREQNKTKTDGTKEARRESNCGFDARLNSKFFLESSGHMSLCLCLLERAESERVSSTKAKQKLVFILQF